MITLMLGTYTHHWTTMKTSCKKDVIIGEYWTPNILGTFHPLHSIKGKWDWKFYARREGARFLI